jgi:hypothetical protein
MIRSFKYKGVERFFESGSRAGIQPFMPRAWFGKCQR